MSEKKQLRYLGIIWLSFMVLIFSAGAVIVQMRPFSKGTSPRWYVFRTVKAAEDTQLTASTQKTAPDETADGIVVWSEYIGAIQIRLRATAAPDKTLSWTLWAYKSRDDPGRYVAHGTATTGATETGNINEYYCDIITITDQQWFKPVKVVSGTPDTIISDAGIAAIALDSCEYRVWRIIIRDIGGGGAEATAAGADITNFY